MQKSIRCFFPFVTTLLNEIDYELGFFKKNYKGCRTFGSKSKLGNLTVLRLRGDVIIFLHMGKFDSSRRFRHVRIRGEVPDSTDFDL
jgi:hypothetical protein